MASKRQLKKSINNLTFELVSECFTYRDFHQDQDPKGINDIIQEIVQTRNDLINKVNQAPAEDKGQALYFTEIVHEMQAMVGRLDKIESLKK